MPATKKSSGTKASPRKVKQVIGARAKITLDDSRGPEVITIETPAGQIITLSAAGRAVDIADGNGNKIRLEPTGITIAAAGKVTVKATEVKVNAGTVTVDAGVTRFTGVVQCDALISNSVVSASYSPGAGNIW